MPAPSDAAVRPATAADHDAVLTTVVAAFDADPAFRWFFPDPDRFAADASTFVAAVLRPRLAAGGVWVVDADGIPAAAVAMWEPPGAVAGGEVASAALPRQVHERLRRWELAAHTLIPDEPHWYLGILATRPGAAGRGLAKLAVAPGSALAAADGATAWLETAHPANVAMYQRWGWVTAGAVDVDDVTCTVLHRP